ncbi:GntR family transcriptional regulator [Gymnodinialimonas sp. 57CJ19]|uniref:FadR/GntR family transcriptional regulator n=1 Tax=Gymnodinialimonas sp. 57CJ19 TaxID=3138498 RepID=UPI00313453D7
MAKASDLHSDAARKRRNTTAEKIKQLILLSGLRPGDSIPTEPELCRELGVSRTSVREAMRTLTTLDIVEVQHGHGSRVGKMSLAPLVETLVFRGVLSSGDDLTALREVVELRSSFDQAMADQLISAHQGHDNQSLAQLVTQMKGKAAKGQTFMAEDRQFHAELLAPIPNKLAGQMVTAFWDVHTAVLPRLGLALPDDLCQTAQAHGDILEAVQSGNHDGYRTAVVRHYEPLLRMLDITAAWETQPENAAS